MTYSVPANSIVEVGVVYPAYYCSPHIQDKTIKNHKRVKFLFAWFMAALQRFTANDVNLLTQAYSDLVGAYKYSNDANVAIRYQNQQQGVIAENLYSRDFDELGEEWTQFKEALYGVGVSYQLVVFNLSAGTFSLTGYQFDNEIRGSMFISSE